MGENIENILPAYGKGCFSDIPSLILTLFGAAEMPSPEGAQYLRTQLSNVIGTTPPSKVALLLADACGWCFLTQFLGKVNALRRIEDEGAIVKITSQFPSTTSAHVTTVNTGLPVGEHGIFEWFMKEPSLGRIIAPLLFSFAGDSERGTLTAAGVTPEAIFPKTNVYGELSKLGVTSHVISHIAYNGSPYNSVVSRGASLVPSYNLVDGLTRLRTVLEAEEKSYVYFYHSDIDTANHRFGPASPLTLAEVEAFFVLLDSLLLQKSESIKDTLLLITADHGGTAISPERTWYLNLEMPGVERWLETGSDGRPLTPAGSPRDMFLYVKPDQLEEAAGAIQRAVGDRARVTPTSALIREGAFGAHQSDAFLTRVGNLVILPAQGEAVWWFEKGRFEQKFYGNHGGLSAEEMEIPLLALRL